MNKKVKAVRLRKSSNLMRIRGTKGLIKRGFENSAIYGKSVLTQGKESKSVLIENLSLQNCTVVFGDKYEVGTVNYKVGEAVSNNGFLKHLKKIGWGAIGLMVTQLLKYLIETYL